MWPGDFNVERCKKCEILRGLGSSIRVSIANRIVVTFKKRDLIELSKETDLFERFWNRVCFSLHLRPRHSVLVMGARSKN